VFISITVVPGPGRLALIKRIKISQVPGPVGGAGENTAVAFAKPVFCVIVIFESSIVKLQQGGIIRLNLSTVGFEPKLKAPAFIIMFCEIPPEALSDTRIWQEGLALGGSVQLSHILL
jgi:hypothetical protein